MATLTNLPLEIQSAIVKFLAPDLPLLGYVESLLGRPSAQETKRFAALCALVRTCKSLHGAATPELYRCPLVKAEQWPVFLRSLVENGKLTNYVETLFLYDLNSAPPVEPSKELYTTFNKILEDRFGSSPDAPLPFSIKPDGDVAYGDDDDDGDEFEARTEKRYACLALTLVPTVQRVILPRQWFSFPNLGDKALPCLRELSYEHEDTEMGVDVADMNEIIRAAPALERFTIMMAGQVGELVISHSLKSINLDSSSLTPESFESLITALPNLESFRYAAGGATVSDEMDASPNQIIQQLIRRRRTLKHLYLDVIEGSYMFAMDEDDIEPGYDLSQLERLETVVLLGGFAQQTVDNQNIPKEAIVDMLPRSVQRIALYCQNGITEAAMLRLAEVASEQFPELKRVRFDVSTTGENGYPSARALFEKAGIVCSGEPVNDMDYAANHGPYVPFNYDGLDIEDEDEEDEDEDEDEDE